MRIFSIFAVFLSLILFLCPVVQGADLTDSLDGVLSGLPADVAELLPEGLFSGDDTQVGEAVSELGGAGFLFDALWQAVLADLDGAVGLFCGLVGVLILSAVLGAVRASWASEGLARALTLCTTATVTATLLSLTGHAMELATRFLERLTVLANALLPAMGGLYAMGGNVSTAVVSSGGMLAFLAVVENLCAATLPGVVGMTVALAVAGVLFGDRLRGLGSFIKKTYTFFLGLVMTVLTFSLSVQTSLTAGADGLAMKSARLLAGRAIPVVGGAVGETFRTLAGSVSYIKTAVGAVGVVTLALLLIPPLVTVLLYRLALMLAGVGAELLGCSAEGRLMEAFLTVFGYFLAVMCICSVGLVLMLALFTRCSVAMG